MATFQQLREGVASAWDTIAEGWRHLYRRASGAITRFIPHKNRSENAGQDGEITVRSSGWGILPAEVFDDDDQVVVRLESPGMEKEDFDIEVLEDTLIIRGEKRLSRERTEGRYHILECAYGSFERAIPLPAEVEPEQATARYRNGVLRIELPKTATQRRHRIQVSTR